MNKYLLIGIVAILVIAGGWWYFNQSNISILSQEQISTQENNDNTAQPTESTPAQTSPVTDGYLNAVPASGYAPFTTEFTARVSVLHSQPGNVVLFFGDGTSTVIRRVEPDGFIDSKTHTYAQAGEYDVMLVFTSESNVDADIQVMKDPNYYKNIIVKKIRVSVQ